MSDTHIYTLDEVKTLPGWESRTEREEFTGYGYHCLQLRPAGVITGIRFTHPTNALDLSPYVRLCWGRGVVLCQGEFTDGLEWDFSVDEFGGLGRVVNTAEVIYLRLEFFGVSGPVTVEIDRLIPVKAV